jgi:hypothetical protein
MQLRELIEGVREKTLTKEQLEGYFDQLCILEAELHLEISDHERTHALYLDNSEEKTHADKERKFNATKEGLRLKELKKYVEAIKPLLASVKSRIYQKIF